MATETILPSGFTTNTWTSGAYTDIDNGVDTPTDGALVLSTELEGAVLLIDFANVATIVDADTVTQVDVRYRAQYGANNKDDIDTELWISGSKVGATQTGVLTGSLANQTMNDPTASTGWNEDWTATELNSIQVKLITTQTGAAGATDIDLSEVEVVITYTAAPVGGTKSYTKSFGRHALHGGARTIYNLSLLANKVAVGDRNLTATLVDLAVADVDAGLNNTRGLTATLVNAAVADVDSTLLLQRDLTATLVDVVVADLDAVLSLGLGLTGTLVDVTVADLDATIQLGADLALIATLVDVVVADLDAALNLSRELSTTVVDIAVADVDGTIKLDANLAPDVINVAVADLKAVISLAGVSGASTGRARRKLYTMLGPRR